MMKRLGKRVLTVLLAGALCAGSLAGCSGSGSGSTASAGQDASSGGAAAVSAESSESNGASSGGQIALIPMTLDNEFYVSMKNGAEEECKKLGYTLTTQSGTSHGDAADQLQLMETMIQKKVKAIMITPCSSTGILSGIKKANAAGIPVVILDTEVDRTALAKQGAKTLTYIGSDNYNGGKVAGEYAKKIAQKEGKTLNTVIITGVPGQENMELRKKGFTDAAGDSIKVVASQNADSDFNKGYNVMTNILTANKNVDFVYCCNDLMALGSLRAVKGAGLEKQVKILGFDGITDAFKSIESGGLCGTVAQKPADMGILGVKAVDEALKGQTVKDHQNTDLVVADSSNVKTWLAYAQKYATK